MHNSRLKKVIGCGSITDGTYKMEVHIINFKEEEYKKLNIKKEATK